VFPTWAQLSSGPQDNRGGTRSKGGSHGSTLRASKSCRA